MKQKLFISALAAGLVGSFALAPVAEARFGRGLRKIGKVAGKVVKVAKPFAGIAAGFTPAGGIMTGLNALKGIKKGGLGGVLKQAAGAAAGGKLGAFAKGARALKGAKGAMGAMGKAKGMIGKAKGIAGKAKGLAGKASKFKKFGSSLMKPGGISGMAKKFSSKLGGKMGKGGFFSSLGKVTKGSGLAAPFKGFLGGNRIGQLNRLRGMTAALASKGGIGLNTIGKFTKRFSGFANMRKGKAASAIKGKFDALKKKLKLSPEQAKAFDQAKNEAAEEAVAQVDQTAQAAVETKVEEELTKVDPAMGKLAEQDPGVPATIGENGEPENKASEAVEASEEAREGVAAAAEEAGAPAPVAEAEEAPAAE